MFYEYTPSELLNKVDGGEVVGSMEKEVLVWVIQQATLEKYGSNSVSGTIQKPAY